MKPPKPQKPIANPNPTIATSGYWDSERKIKDGEWRSFTKEERKEIERHTEKYQPKPDVQLTPEIKEAGLAEYGKLYNAPFSFHSGAIFDANDNMVLQIRGWGHIQYSTAKNVTPEQIQDSFGEEMCEVLNKWYKERYGNN